MKSSQQSFVNMVLSAAVMLLISSCATFSSSGVGRVKEYTVDSEQLPPAFDGFRIAFVSDLHYPSLFSKKRLTKLVARIGRENPDILLLGGDYVTDNDSVGSLFSALSAVDAPYGIYAVLGNHEKGNGHIVSASMAANGIRLINDEALPLCKEGTMIFLAGVNDCFAPDSLLARPGEAPGSDAFVMLLAHTPDYAERISTTADLVLSGHTHGGQVSLFGLYTPVCNSIYGTRFLRGRNRTSAGSTVITTNGVGTSRRKVRFCVPSEIVVVTLRSIPR